MSVTILTRGGGARAPFSAALAIALLSLISCKASGPNAIEGKIAQEAKEVTIGGKDWINPTPDNEESRKAGAAHFQHHCQICHGLDGQNTGVPFASKMSPQVADLASQPVQEYKDGQLKWIIENGIRFSGMPAWKGILTDEEMWHMVRFLRHLPQTGSLGAPKMYQESAHEHEGTKAQHAAKGEHHH
jgi:mono/diheme cytochrome c family protein